MSNYLNVGIFLMVVLILANNTDPHEMTHNAAFHLKSSMFAKVPVDGYP